MDRPVQIRNRLYLCDIDTVAQTDTSDFDTVVSVCQDHRCENVEGEMYHFPLADDYYSYDSWGGSTDYQTFREAANSVVERLESGRVLVHCHVGKNRSAGVCAAVSGVVDGLDANDAIENVRTARPVMNMTPMIEGFVRQYILENE